MLPASSTAEAARMVGERVAAGDNSWAAIAPASSAPAHNLVVLADGIADHESNQTRFVVVGNQTFPARSGHDRTAIVVYQRADDPGSLISILQVFAARWSVYDRSERAEAQTFLNELFTCYGTDRQAVATCEEPQAAAKIILWWSFKTSPRSNASRPRRRARAGWLPLA